MDFWFHQRAWFPDTGRPSGYCPARVMKPKQTMLWNCLIYILQYTVCALMGKGNNSFWCWWFSRFWYKKNTQYNKMSHFLPYQNLSCQMTVKIYNLGQIIGSSVGFPCGPFVCLVLFVRLVNFRCPFILLPIGDHLTLST